MSGCLDAIVLDCDGVILESVDVKTRAFASTVKRLGPEAVDILLDYHLSHGGISRYEKYRHLWRELYGREIDDETLARLSRAFSAACVEGVLRAPFVPGAEAFIQAARERWPLYVASGTPEDELRQIFEARGLAPLFTGIYGSPRTKTELLATIMAENGYAPGRTLMVGDSITDLKAAQAAGTLFYSRGAFSNQPGGPDLTGLMAFIDGLPCPES